MFYAKGALQYLVPILLVTLAKQVMSVVNLSTCDQYACSSFAHKAVCFILYILLEIWWGKKEDQEMSVAWFNWDKNTDPIWDKWLCGMVNQWLPMLYSMTHFYDGCLKIYFKCGYIFTLGWTAWHLIPDRRNHTVGHGFKHIILGSGTTFTAL